jgi:two-component system chemotaxis response regulator CheB
VDAGSTEETGLLTVIVFGASAGGITALGIILASLPQKFPAAIAIVQHRSSEPGLLAETLSLRGGRHVRDAVDGDQLAVGSIFLAPAGKHLLINADASLSVSESARVRFSRPAVDRLFESGAESLKERLIAVVLTGHDGDGSDGARAVRRMGGRVIAQDPQDAEVPSMPISALNTGCVDWVLPLRDIGPFLESLVADESL